MEAYTVEGDSQLIEVFWIFDLHQYHSKESLLTTCPIAQHTLQTLLEVIQKGELNAGDAEAIKAFRCIVRIDAGAVSPVVSSNDDEAVAQNTKNVWRTLQELELLVSNKFNSWRTKNLSCFIYLSSSIFCFFYLRFSCMLIIFMIHSAFIFVLILFICFMDT